MYLARRWRRICDDNGDHDGDDDGGEDLLAFADQLKGQAPQRKSISR